MASIAEWLHDLPTPPRDCPVFVATSPPRKRRRLSSTSSANNMENITPTKQKKQRNAADTSADVTPRSYPPLIKSLQLQSPCTSTDAAANDAVETSSQVSCDLASISATSATSLKRKRSISPSKRLARLALLPYPIHQQTIDRISDLPEILRPLTRTMRKIEKAKEIISKDAVAELQAYIADDEEEYSALAIDEKAACGSTPTLEFAHEIVKTTNKNKELFRSEAAWNGNVHEPLLREAWSRSTHKSSLCYENITTARITTATTASSHKADFAIVFELDSETQRALAQQGIFSLCHTDYNPVCYRPPSVSIETKTEAAGTQQADLQLNTWAYAQVASLRNLLVRVGRGDAQIPALPLLIVQDGQWWFSYFEVKGDCAVRWSKVAIGDTATIKGVYQIVTALQRLMEWTINVWKHWFVREVLEPLLSSSTNTQHV